MKRFLVLFLLFSGMTLVWSTTIYVPEDYTAIQTAIDASVNGDVVLVSPGTYYENIDFLGKAITVASLFHTIQDTSYISQTIIDGNQNGSVVSFLSGEGNNSRIIGFTLTNGLEMRGGGIVCDNDSSPHLEYLRIINNTGVLSGGGIQCWGSSPHLENIDIKYNNAGVEANTAGCNGGGIYCDGYPSQPVLENVTIAENTARGLGAGLYLYNSTPVFSDTSRCNIYNNNGFRGNGNDIWCESSITVFVDTFTVLYPTSFHAAPLGNFTFSILHGMNGQVNGDIYVSPEGSNENSGLTPEEPLQTIHYATSIITTSENAPRTIHLAEGVYSSSQTGEHYPLSLPDHVSVIGENENTVILDVENYGNGFMIFYNDNIEIANLTIINAFSRRGAGVYSALSSVNIHNVTIENCTCENNGAGINSFSSDLYLENVTISNNIAGGDGGGIYLSYDNPVLTNVTITNNTAESGGGIYCYQYSCPVLENVTISNNSALETGGGIGLRNGSNLAFSNENRCSIYNNSSLSGYGNDLYFTISEPVEVIVDTFSVLIPSAYHAHPIENISFDILNGMQNQAGSCVYVSPDGDNNNSGLSEVDPVQTIQYASSIIIATQDQPGTIFLLEGSYGPTSNGDSFPIGLFSNLSLTGENESSVILDAEGLSRVLHFEYMNNVNISNLTVTNGYCSGSSSDGGGGIYCIYSNANISNVTVAGNAGESSGGGIYCRSSDLILQEVTIAGNSCLDGGGGLFSNNSDISMENVLIDNNSTEAGGGGIFFLHSNTNLYDVTITNNTAENGGAIFCRNHSFIDLVNVTIADNFAVLDGGGINLGYECSMNLVNCIMWNDYPYEIWIEELFYDQYFNVTHSDIEGGNEGIIFFWQGGNVNWLTGNIDEDPLFLESGWNDYYLTENSPCIDSGTTYFEYAGEVILDLEEDEYYGLAPDMGAYEYEGEFIINYGDIDNNGSVESYDVALLLQYIVGLDPLPEDPVPWEEWRLQRADVDLDGMILAVDAAYILQYIVEIINELPVCNSIRASENIIMVTSDPEYLYLSSEKETLSLSYQIRDCNNLKLGKPEVLKNDCLYYENERKFALATAIGKSGEILRIPYERIADSGSSITLELESNGYIDQISYTFGDPVPETTQLNVIYPNPFNPETTISYQLAEQGNVKIEAYNIKGQKVDIILDEIQVAGYHTFNWNAANHNSGVYFICLTCGSEQEVKKVLLLK